MVWGSQKNDPRSRRLVSLASQHELCFENGGSPTFLHGETYSSCLDLTLVSISLTDSAQWFTDIETHGSDQLPTYLKIEGPDSLLPGKITVNKLEELQILHGRHLPRKAFLEL